MYRSIQCLDLASLYKKKKVHYIFFLPCAVTPMESFQRQSVWTLLRFLRVVSSTCQCVFVFVLFFCFVLFLLWPCLWTWNMLGNSSLLWAVFKYTAVGFLEALKPFAGLFHNGSILSFALVRGIDPGSFVSVIEFLCRCGVVITWYHITVGWRVTGERSNLLNVSAPPWDRVKKKKKKRKKKTGQWRHDKSVHNYSYTFMKLN